MEIKATSKYDYNLVKALIHLGMFKKADPKKRMIMWNILIFILIIVNIKLDTLYGTDVTSIGVWGVAITLCLLNACLYFVLPKVKYKQLANWQNATNEYTFKNDIIMISTTSNDDCGSSEIKYSMIKKVMETSRYLFIFDINKQIVIVDKTSIDGDENEQIRSKLRSYIGNKYIVCNY